ncbi:YheC/YheD family protein [Neobacillus sp. PS3-34]|uniref:YheC/YheD family endospore coat-associated protein n=1 Tax=Neobacillus sp. PS3-34 TaxID=3070678 RepID=UPI0027E208AB|nr:YheC/YheD family protein [Neobacillus sp. PS3-34]WML49666.1 YheC/YheD family protein [Neobacillus sp. PS3-34]
MKNTFGIMALSQSSEQTYFQEISMRAASLGLECYRFIPSNIDPVSHQVKGLRFQPEDGSWIESKFPLPSIIYDRCFYGEDEHSKQCIPIVSWLKSRTDITFLGYGLPDKLELNEALSHSILAPYLPPSSFVSDAGLVLTKLNQHKKLIIKPINGSQGYGIYYLKKNERNFHVKTEKQKKIISRIFPNETKLVQWLQQLLKSHRYLVQPYLELSNNELQPFDIRIFLQKDEQGKWIERGKGIRVGNTGGILSNLSAGGKVVDFNSWLTTIPSDKHEYICSEIKYIGEHLPFLLEKEFLPLFELGIDLGLAKDGSLWILDVNSKPGRKVILNTHPELKDTLFFAPLLYGKLICSTEATERKTCHAKTLSH